MSRRQTVVRWAVFLVAESVGVYLAGRGTNLGAVVAGAGCMVGGVGALCAGVTRGSA